MKKRLVNFKVDPAFYGQVRAKVEAESINLSSLLRDVLRSWLKGDYRTGDVFYVLSDEVLVDIAKMIVYLFLENRDKYELEDDDNWVDVQSAMFSALEGTDD